MSFSDMLIMVKNENIDVLMIQELFTPVDNFKILMFLLSLTVFPLNLFGVAAKAPDHGI